MLKKNTLYIKLNRFFIFIKNENGAILLSFIFFLPVIIGLLFLSFEISHFIQKKARLSDAIEQATLALTIDNDEPPDGDNIKKEENRNFVIAYAKAYLPNETFSKPAINITSHSDHIKYQVDMTIHYPTKILNKIFQKVSSEVSINDNSRAIKYIAKAAEPTDVVFVTDYSGSMKFKFYDSNNEQVKIEALRKVFNNLYKKIQKNDNINIIGFVPFSWGTKISTSHIVNDEEVEKYCHFPFVPNAATPNFDYLKKYTLSRLKQFPGLENLDSVDNIKYGECLDKDHKKIKNEINEILKGNVEKKISEYLDTSCKISESQIIREVIESNIDYTATIKSIGLVNKPDQLMNIKLSDLLNGSICLKGSSAITFGHEITSLSQISDVLNAAPLGGTLVSSGILAANNIFQNAYSSRDKLMIILSDGNDSNDDEDKSSKKARNENYFYITQKLINMGMCERIKDNNIKMVFIAIGYIPKEDIDWKKCVGEKNFYLAKNVSELKLSINQALARIDTEVGRNIPKN